MAEILSFLNITNEDRKISITNVLVLIFCTIVALRTAFAGLDINLGIAVWHVKDLDLASVIPMLFSLLNYAHKRQVTLSNQPKPGIDSVAQQ